MALDPETRKWLEKNFIGNVKFDEPMAKHTSFRIGGPVDALVFPESVDELVKLVGYSRQIRIPCRVFGDGTNLLVKDTGISGIVVTMSRGMKKISHSVLDSGDVLVSAMAGAKMNALCSYAINSGFAGMNFAFGIPGTVGGGIMMNAGTNYGAVSHVIDSVDILLPHGKKEKIEKENMNFFYRKLLLDNDKACTFQGDHLVLGGNFRLRRSDRDTIQKEADDILKKRKKNQPLNKSSAGCFFKNPDTGKTAGELIDLAGLKGQRIGGAKVSEKHANFIINNSGATASDVIRLMELIRENVFKTFNITLEPEVKIVG